MNATEKTFTTYFDNGLTGDQHVRLELDEDGLLYETNNASTRQLVCSALFVDWDRCSPKWLAELTEFFDGRRDVAKRYVEAADDQDK